MSSARVVRCWVKSRNERNPCRQLPSLSWGLWRDCLCKEEEGGMTSNHHAPYDLGHTRATMDGTEGSEGASRSGPQKPVPSSDCSLQLDCTKPESLVIADQHAAVNTFSGLVHTARHTMRVGNTRSRRPNPQGRELSKVGLMIGVKS